MQFLSQSQVARGSHSGQCRYRAFPLLQEGPVDNVKNILIPVPLPYSQTSFLRQNPDFLLPWSVLSSLSDIACKTHSIYFKSWPRKHALLTHARILRLALHTCTSVSWPAPALPARLTGEKGLRVQLRWQLSFHRPRCPVWLCARGMREEAPHAVTVPWDRRGDVNANRSARFCLPSNCWVRDDLLIFFGGVKKVVAVGRDKQESGCGGGGRIFKKKKRVLWN